MKLIINRYIITSWFFKSLMIILGIAILKLILPIPIPNRPLGVPVLYFSAFIILGYFLMNLKIPKVIKKEVLIYSLFWVISVLTSYSKIVSISSFLIFSIMYLIYQILFIHCINLKKDDVKQLMHQFINIMFWGCSISLVLFAVGMIKDPNIFDVFGINRNNFVFLVVMALIMQFMLMINKLTKKRVMLFIIFILTIVFIMSRTAYIAILVSIFLFLFSQIRKKKRNTKDDKRVKRLKKFFIFGLISILGLFLISPTFQSRVRGMTEIVQILGAQKLTNQQLGGRRQLLMLAHLNLFFQNPLTGVGTGQSNELLDKNTIGTSVGSSHNTQIRVLAEHGLIGFVLLFIFYLMIFKQLKKTSQWDQYSQGFYYGYISLLILSFGNEYFLTNPMVWVFISLGYSYSLNLTHEKNINH